MTELTQSDRLLLVPGTLEPSLRLINTQAIDAFSVSW